MKKICTKCNKEWTDLNDDDLFCPDCCGKLDSVSEPIIPAAAPQRGMQIDNRIHKGDKIDIGGDSLSAQNIDNRTMTTNTNNTTTINNYQNIVDETKKVCKCELSGRMVSIMDIVECPKCHRMVSSQFYVDRSFMCVDCYEKLENKPRPEPQRVKPQTPFVGNTPAPQPTPQPQPEPEPVRIEPVVPPVVSVAQPAGKKPMGKIIIGVVAVVAVVVAVLVMGGKDEPQSQEPPKSEAPAAEVKPAPKAEAAPKAQQTKPAAPAQQAKPAAPAPEKKPAAPAKPKETGADAYNKGNYIKAELLLKAEAEKGVAASAYYLALMYKDGKGVAKNAKQAFSYMRSAAEGGCADAYYELGEMYRIGVGTEANRANAKKWYEMSVMENGKGSDQAAKRLQLYR